MKIILDYDATLVDLMTPWLRHLDKGITTETIRYFGWLRDAFGHEADDYWRMPGIYDNDVSPIPGSRTFVRALLTAGHEVEVISACHEDMLEEKQRHCRGLYPGLIMRSSHDKHLESAGALLIDDCPRHAHAHVRHNHGSKALLFNYKGSYGWARPLFHHPNIQVVTDYSQILSIIGGQGCQ